MRLPTIIEERIDEFTGRTWLLPALLDWYEETDERMLLLTGEPGAGKSMLMAWLAGAGPAPQDGEASALLDRLRSQVKAAHFCVAASGSIAPEALASNMTEQLVANVPGFAEALAASLADLVTIAPSVWAETVHTGGTVTGVHIENLNLGDLGEELSFNRTLREPLQRLYQDGYDQKMLLLVDALDEAATYTGSIDLVRLLSRLEDLPPEVRFLVSSGHDPAVLKHYREVPRLDLIQDAPDILEDARAYASDRLSELDDRRRAWLAEHIARAAEGNFLYAHLVLADLLPHLPEVSDLEAFPLPHKLGGLYHSFLTRQLGADEERWYSLYRPLLGLVAVAQGEGLTRSQLERITGKELEYPLRVCGQVLEGQLPEGPFRVFHMSFAGFLLDDPDNVDYHVDAARSHAQIADYYWATHHPDWQTCDAYGLENLALHLHQSNQTERLRRLISKEWMRARSGRGFAQDCMLAWPDLDERIGFFRQAAQSHPEWDAALLHLARLQQMARLRERGLESYDVALARLDEAEQAIMQVVSAHEGWHPYVLCQRGYLAKDRAQVAQDMVDEAAKEQHLQQAETCFKLVLLFNPEDAGAHNGMGNVLVLRGDVDTAIQAIKRAIECDETFTSAHWDLAVAYQKKMSLDKEHAFEWCRRALEAWLRTYELAEEDPDYQADLGTIGQTIAWLADQCGEGLLE
jgi:tetratricopeptide (TPR) repeat protein